MIETPPPAPAETVRLAPDEAAAWLAQGLDRPLHVTFTRNRVSQLSVRHKPDGLHLRAQARLLEAPPDIWRALKRFLLTRARRDWRALAEQLARLPAPGPATPPRLPPLRTAGAVHDLDTLLRAVNAAHFPGPCATRITWGRRARRPGRPIRHILFGAYHPVLDLIRIHPLLDDPRVPAEFVSFIIFHERLHARLGAELKNGRLRHHSPHFHGVERQYPDFPRLHALGHTLTRTLAMPCRPGPAERLS